MMFTRVFHRVRRAAHGSFLIGLFALAGVPPAGAATAGATLAPPNTITLAWDGVTDPSVAGYNIYYGPGSRTYTNMVTAGMVTSTVVPNLQPGATYYFAATTVTVAGLESDYSTETTYAIPVPNQPPTLAPISDINIQENAGTQTVNLTGISSGSPTEIQTLTVTAFSGNPGLIPNPTVTYTSPNTSGTLTFAPAANASGSAVLTVMVDDGGSVSNTVIQSFTVNVAPYNAPPTLNPLGNLTVNENAAAQTINLTGISSGAANEVQALSVTATSSNPSLVPNPTVTYSSPNPGGTLTLAPLANTYGTATITVAVNDGQPINNVVSQSFVVTVNQTIFPPTPLTNAIVKPNVAFLFPISSPYKKGEKWTCSLAPGAPADAAVSTLNHVPTLMWTPSIANASTTNQIWIQVTDQTTPSLSTNELVVVIVQDYLNVALGSGTVQASQNVALPLSVTSSDGLTNFTFTVNVGSNRFLNPTLSGVSSLVGSSSLQNQGTNLLITIQAAAGQVLQGSYSLAQLNFQTMPVQSSGFVQLPVNIVTGIKPDGTVYADSVGTAGMVAVVGDVPLLQGAGVNGSTVSLNLLGKVGTSYQLLSSTGMPGSAPWVPLLTYTQTNVSQPFNLIATGPMAIYRLLQK
jgi:hypothetical protein